MLKRLSGGWGARRGRWLAGLTLVVLAAGLYWHFSQPRKLIVTTVLLGAGEIFCTRDTGIFTWQLKEDTASKQFLHHLHCFDWSGQLRWQIASPTTRSAQVRNPICISPDGRLAAAAVVTARGFRILRWRDGQPQPAVEIACDLVKLDDADLVVNIKDNGEVLAACGPASLPLTELFLLAGGKVIARGTIRGFTGSPVAALPDESTWYERSLAAGGETMIVGQISASGPSHEHIYLFEYVSLNMAEDQVQAIHRYRFDAAPFSYSDLLADGTLINNNTIYTAHGKVAYFSNISQAWAPDGQWLAECYPGKMAVSGWTRGKREPSWQAAIPEFVLSVEVCTTAGGEYAAISGERESPFIDALAKRLNHPEWLQYSTQHIMVFQRPGRLVAQRTFLVKNGRFDPAAGKTGEDLLRLGRRNFSPLYNVKLSPDGRRVALSTFEDGDYAKPCCVLLGVK